MKTWSYSYKTSDGLRHEAEMVAPDRNTVYTELRKQGIRAIRVEERVAPIVRQGFRGLHLRDWASISAVIVLLVAVAVLVQNHVRPRAEAAPPETTAPKMRASRVKESPYRIESEAVELKTGARVARSRPRRWLGPGARPAFAEIFKHPSEAYLANFAEPGVLPEPLPAPSDEVKADFFDVSDMPIMISPEDSRLVAELKRIVVGIKEEVFERVASGSSFEEVVDWLVERSRMEMDYRARAKERLDDGASLEEANRALAAMGMAPIK